VAQNLASKFSEKVSKRLVSESVVGAVTNKNFDWTSVDTIKVYSVNTTPLQDYNRSGDGDRYGERTEVGTTTQTWQLAEDKAINATIDRLNASQSMGVIKPGLFLAQEVDEVIVPYVNAYVLQTIVTAGAAADRDDIVSDGATTSGNAYTNFLAIQADISDKLGKQKGRVAVMTAAYYNMLKQGGFVLDSDSAYADRKSGKLGTVDGCEVVIHTSAEMPAATDLIITHKDVTTFADVLTDYITHKNPVGVNGHKIEGRIAFDSFVDVNKVNQIGIHKTS
jgi:hypothetical protein